ncbi:MAG: hypothetical protein V2J89_08800 [Halieaceae bacterium]|jgi:hypothetical protein|nr:hypothetical protein [Halieaceae bacterium]
MSLKHILGGVAATALMTTLSIPAMAGSSEALAACKTEIAADERLAQYEFVAQNTESIKRRGRYTSFEIDVKAKDANGETHRWEAACKARNNGRLETLTLVQVGTPAGDQVARTAK